MHLFSKLYLCSQGAVREDADAAVLELDSDAGDGVVPPNLRGASSPTCRADGESCRAFYHCCSEQCGCGPTGKDVCFSGFCRPETPVSLAEVRETLEEGGGEIR